MDISEVKELETTSRRSRGIKKLAIGAAKLMVTGACFWYISRQIDFGEVLSAIPWLDFRWAGFAIVVAVLQIPVAGVRLWNIVDALVTRNASMTPALLILVTAVGVFFAQVLPSVAGDGVRAWLL